MKMCEEERNRGRDDDRKGENEGKMRRSIRFKSMNLEIPIIHARKYMMINQNMHIDEVTHTHTPTLFTSKIHAEPMNCLCICVSIAHYQSASLILSLSLSLALGWIHKFIYEFDNITTDI